MSLQNPHPRTFAQLSAMLDHNNVRRLDDALPELSAAQVIKPSPNKAWDTFKTFNAGREVASITQADICNAD